MVLSSGYSNKISSSSMRSMGWSSNFCRIRTSIGVLQSWLKVCMCMSDLGCWFVPIYIEVGRFGGLSVCIHTKSLADFRIDSRLIYGRCEFYCLVHLGCHGDEDLAGEARHIWNLYKLREFALYTNTYITYIESIQLSKGQNRIIQNGKGSG